MRVYRVEHKHDHRGPYTGNGRGVKDALLFQHLMGLKTHGNSPVHPSSSTDILCEDWGWDTHIHGFSSMELLYQWFEGCLMALYTAGFVIREYDVPSRDVCYGTYQIVFAHREAVLVK